MTESFDWVGDEFLDGRKKLIHTVGTVTKVSYTSVGSHPYTGVFTGCDNVLIRASVGHAPDPSKTTAEGAFDNFTPGLSIKWLRDGFPSANLQVMFSTEGQKSWNFFRFDFPNHLPDANSPAIVALAKKFATATPYVQTVGLRDLAAINCKGTTVATPKYPWMVIFRPDPALQSRHPDTYRDDYMKQLKSIPSGTAYYDVYAYATPQTTTPVKIGSIKTISASVSSYWGDESFFFRHNFMEYDLKENPSWEAYTPKPFALQILLEENTTPAEVKPEPKKHCPFGKPNLK